MNFFLTYLYLNASTGLMRDALRECIYTVESTARADMDNMVQRFFSEE
jgi:hypothetical protein